MPVFRIHRFSVKYPDAVFLDDSSFTEEQDQAWKNYINNFVSMFPGYVANSGVYTLIDENTRQLTIRIKAPEGKEQLYAENYIREVGMANNEYKTAYFNMRRELGERIDPTKSFWNVEYANGHVQTYKFGG